jgi:hypothetical protein
MTKLPKRKKIVGWKKLQDRLIAKLEIPSSAKRVLCHGQERKCRAERVKVLAIYIGCPYAREWNAAHGQSNEVSGGISCFSETRAYYKVGHVTYANGFDPSPDTQCSYGINFFLTKEEAERYGP